MKGFLKQIVGEDGDNIGLYLVYQDIDDETLYSAYVEYDNSDDSLEMDFDDWYNIKKDAIVMERVYVDEIII